MQVHSFALEHLEGRALFSVFAPVDIAPMTAVAAPVHQVMAASRSPLAGAFNVAGTYTQPLGNPDVGPKYDFNGKGKKKPLGKFRMTGHVQTPGFINNGRSSGHLVFTTSRGTITLRVVGPPQPPGSLPASFTYTIVKGTGAYASSRGKGHFAVSASDTTHKFVFRFNQAIT